MALLVKFGDELPQCLAQFDIDSGRRLVQHNDGRLVDQGLCHQHAAFHATRELPHIRVGFVGETQVFEQFINPGVIVFDTKIARLNPQNVAHFEKGVKHQLLRHDTQFAPGVGIVSLNIMPQHADFAAAGPCEAGEHADHRGFPRTIGAQEAKKFTLLYVKTDIIQGQKAGALGVFG